MIRAYNPILLLNIIKKLLFDLDRLQKINNHELQKIQDKSFKKIVRWAYTVPLYNQKYKKNGIHPSDIKGINDIEKLPIISKDDIREFYPHGIHSYKISKDRLVEISTSGTTGKKLSLFVDFSEIITGLFGYLRALREYNINWRKTKITIIGDFASHTAESGYIYNGLQTIFRNNFFFQNIQWLNTNDPPEKIIQQIDCFKPQFIGGYVGMIGHLAVLKEKGLGKNISPTHIGLTGSVLGKELKKYIEDIFNAHIFEIYGATESGPIAIQCKHGSYHILSDLVFLEFFNKKKSCLSGEAGKILVTKLYGKGTPIIRYNAINDIVSPRYETCRCNMCGGLIERIYGRDDLSLILRGGRLLLPSSISDIFSKVLYILKTSMVRDLQVTQHDLDTIEVQLVLDKNLIENSSLVQDVFSIIKESFKEKVGPGVKIIIKDVDKIQHDGPRIISKLNPKEYRITQYV